MIDKIIGIWENKKVQDFVSDNRDLLIKVAAAALLAVAAFFVFVFTDDGDGESIDKEQEIITENDIPTGTIMVDIGGEVVNPMVAELNEGSRVEDAINAAGGLTDEADITDINRAAFLEDGDKILVPSKADGSDFDQNSSESKGNMSAQYSDKRININTADNIQLQELDGIGPVTAEKIIEYRDENGRFDSIEDIKNVSGIGEITFDKIKDDIKT